MAIEDDRRQGVQPVANQKNLFFRKQLFRAGKTGLVYPIRLGDPLDALLVIRYKGIRDAPTRHQVGVDATRYFSWQPFDRLLLMKLPIIS